MVYEVKQVVAGAQLLGVAPVLLVSDVASAAAYYRDRLGFSYDNFFGSPPHFCIIYRDGCSMMLSYTKDPQSIVPHYRVVDRMWNAYFWVDNVELLYKEFVDRGAEIDYSICQTRYGIREFGVKDINGYDIGFGQIID